MGHNRPPNEKEILEQRLADYKDLQAELKRLAAVKIPEEIADEKQGGQVTQYVKSVKDAKKELEKIHKNEKAIYLECGRVVDAWKKNFETQFDALISAASKPLLAFQEKKDREERERQLEIARKAREEAERLAAEAAAHEAEKIHDTASELMGMAIQADIKAEMIEGSALSVKTHTRSEAGAVSSTSKVWTGRIESLAALDLDALRPYISEDALDRAVKAYAKDTKGADLRGAVIYQESKLNIR